MEYLSNDYYFGGNAVLGLCLIHTPEVILDKYDFHKHLLQPIGREKRIKKFCGRPEKSEC